MTDQYPYGYPPPTMPLPRRRHPGRTIFLVALMLVAAVGAGAVLGTEFSRPRLLPVPTSPRESTPISRTDVSAVAAKVAPALVDINTTLGFQQASAAGTGIVLTSSGVVLTNNHVIDGATAISVTDVGNGRTYDASVVGYDRTHDIAVLTLQGASGLTTASIGGSGDLAVGDQVLAIGNAGGTGGAPSVAAGAVTALNQSITATNDSDGSSERLTGLIQVDANVQPGDSGGPLVDSRGTVVGVDTAASKGFQMQAGTGAGFAIPIADAMAIGNQIQSHQASDTVHIGPTAILGVQLVSGGRRSATGAVVGGVLAGTPADDAGITRGDVIVSVNDQNIDSATTLSTVMIGLHPGDVVRLGWLDSTGRQASADVRLATGPAM